MLELKFVLLAILAGIFLIVALPVGIVFLIFTLIYYYASKLQNQGSDVITHDVPASDTYEFTDTDEYAEQIPYSNLDYRQLFDDDRYIQEQEKHK